MSRNSACLGFTSYVPPTRVLHVHCLYSSFLSKIVHVELRKKTGTRRVTPRVSISQLSRSISHKLDIHLPLRLMKTLPDL